MFKKKQKTKVFQVPLAESILCNRSATASSLVADVVTDVITYLEKHEFYTMEGIYRVPGRQSRLEALRESYDKGKPIEFEAKMEDPFTCADLLLLYLRSLPEPLLPANVTSQLESAGDNLALLQSAVFQLAPCNRVLCSIICQHAAKVISAEQSNKMGLKNLTIVFVPSMYCSPKVFSTLVQRSKDIFSPLCSNCQKRIIPLDSPPQFAQQLLCPQCDPHPSGQPDELSEPDFRKSAVGQNGAPVNGAVAVSATAAVKGIKSPLFSRLSRSSSTGARSSNTADAVGSASPVSSSSGSPTTSVVPKKPLPSSPGPNSKVGGGGGGGGPVKSPRGGGGLSPRSGVTASSNLVSGAVFGQSLASVCRTQVDTGVVVLPSLVRQCWKYVEQNARANCNVYCVDPSSLALVDSIQAKFDASISARVNLADELQAVNPPQDAVLIAGALFKRYLAMLPASVFSAEMLPSFEDVVQNSTNEARPLMLSSLVFKLSIELRTFLLHFISHIRTLVKQEAASIDTLLEEFALVCKCSNELLVAVYNNRRTILQPNCTKCDKLIGLADQPKFIGTDVLCVACGGVRKQ